MSSVVVTSTIAYSGMRVKRNPVNWMWGNQDHNDLGVAVSGTIGSIDLSGWASVKWDNGWEHNYPVEKRSGDLCLLLDESESSAIPPAAKAIEFCSSTYPIEIGQLLVFGRHMVDSSSANIHLGEEVEIVKVAGTNVITNKKLGWWVPKGCFIKPDAVKFAEKKPEDSFYTAKEDHTIEVGDYVRYKYPNPYEDLSKELITCGTYIINSKWTGTELYFKVKLSGGKVSRWIPARCFELSWRHPRDPKVMSSISQPINTEDHGRSTNATVHTTAGSCGDAFKIQRKAVTIPGQGESGESGLRIGARKAQIGG